MLITLDLNDEQQVSQILALQQLALAHDASEASLTAAPAQGELLLGWQVEQTLLGALGYTIGSAEIQIQRLVVAPAASRKGIATRLLMELFLRAGTHSIGVATESSNSPAIVLYTDLGFTVERETRNADGTRQVHLHRSGIRQP